MKKVAFALVACVSLAAFSATAHAEESETTTAPPPPVKDAPPKTESRWYGYQTLSADGAALAFGAIAASSDSRAVQSGFGLASFLSYAIVPGVIHGVHGHAGKAAGDIAIRLLTPVIGGFLGAVIAAATYKDHSIASSSDDIIDLGGLTATLTGGAIGFSVGVVTAVVLDAAVLARETVEVEAPAKPAPKQSALTVMPSATPTKNGFSAGLNGTF